jgi:hypothetical protein
MKSMAIFALGAALAAPSLAFAACDRPTPPTALDSASVTLEQLQAAKGAVTGFIAASDAYQSCVLDDLAAQRAAAKAAKTKLDPAIAKAAEDKVSENQADKERVGTEFNTAVKAFKAAHPS